MHLRFRLISAGAAAALAASLLAVAGPSSATPTEPVEVTPSSLPVGATPTVSWYRSAGNEIVRPGQRPVKIKPGGAVPGGGAWLLNARGGWLRHTYADGTSFVGANGKARRLGPKSGFETQLVAPNGRTFVDRLVRYATSDVNKWSTTVRVRRTGDGKVLRSRTFQQTGVQVQAVTSSVVALTVVSPRAGGNSTWATKYWNQRTGRLHVFSRQQTEGAPGPDFFPGPAASLSHRLIAVGEQGFQSVRNSRTGRELWRTSGDERTYRFSPGGTRVVTLADYFNGYEDGGSYRLMRIRDARTGAVLATFHGYFLFETDDRPIQGPIWESESKVLVVAYDTVTADDEGYFHPSGAAWIRCTAAGSCVRVPINPSGDHVTIPRSS